MSEPKACVIGWPIKHSRSPVIHRFWLNALGIAGDYVLQPVEPDTVKAFFAGFRDSGYVGCNVTVPHKEAAFAAVDEMEPVAETLGALNTIWLEGGRLVGASTDSFGFLANLDGAAAGWHADPGAAVVLGAGGAARAIAWALLSRGFAPIHVVNRTPARAKALAERFGPSIRPAGWPDLPTLLPSARLLVNTTSLGMEGQPDLRVDVGALGDHALVNDLVYSPLETTLLANARSRGLAAVDGLGMLLHQAVPGFEHWFGTRPEVTPELRAAVLATLDDG
ncbi:MAG: shikimate dehydrogenase [Hyphomicrobiales bacterium]|nr:shikimate dehydrogenase [Hyphomicrobiales bacterium]